MNTKTINIYGDITSYPYMDSDISSSMLAKELGEEEYDEIIVNISSFGGEVAEGLSIYNQLKNHKAKVKTVCNGFACSIASIIFLAGDERVMCENSLLMIHDAWVASCGNSKELKKIAEDLEKINQQSINIYQEVSGLDEDKIKELLDNETWLDSKEAMELGFVTSIQSEKKSSQASQSAKKALMKLILKAQVKEDEKNNDDNTNNKEDDNKDIEKKGQENKTPKELNKNRFYKA